MSLLSSHFAPVAFLQLPYIQYVFSLSHPFVSTLLCLFLVSFSSSFLFICMSHFFCRRTVHFALLSLLFFSLSFFYFTHPLLYCPSFLFSPSITFPFSPLFSFYLSFLFTSHWRHKFLRLTAFDFLSVSDLFFFSRNLLHFPLFLFIV